jgi:CRP-like cAMP-binding protein
MQVGPLGLGTGAVLAAPGGGTVFRLRSGWLALTRGGSAGGHARVVALALPGDIVGADDLAAERADAALCLRPVCASACDGDGLRLLAARDRDAALYLLSSWAGRRRTSSALAALPAGAKAHRRIAAMLSVTLGRLRLLGHAARGAFVLPLTPAQVAEIVQVPHDAVAGALERLMDARVIRCAHATRDGFVFDVADDAGLRSLGGLDSADVLRAENLAESPFRSPA